MTIKITRASTTGSKSIGTPLASEVKREVSTFLNGNPKPLSKESVTKLNLEKLSTRSNVPVIAVHVPAKGIDGGSRSMAYIIKGTIYANVRNTTAKNNDRWFKVGPAPAAAPETIKNTVAVQRALNSTAGKSAIIADVKKWLGPKGSGDNYLNKKYGDGIITLLSNPIKVTGSGKEFTVEAEVNDNELWGGSYDEHLFLKVDLSGAKPRVFSYKEPQTYKTVN